MGTYKLAGTSETLTVMPLGSGGTGPEEKRRRRYGDVEKTGTAASGVSGACKSSPRLSTTRNESVSGSMVKRK